MTLTPVLIPISLLFIDGEDNNVIITSDTNDRLLKLLGIKMVVSFLPSNGGYNLIKNCLCTSKHPFLCLSWISPNQSRLDLIYPFRKVAERYIHKVNNNYHLSRVHYEHLLSITQEITVLVQ